MPWIPIRPLFTDGIHSSSATSIASHSLAKIFNTAHVKIWDLPFPYTVYPAHPQDHHLPQIKCLLIYYFFRKWKPKTKYPRQNLWERKTADNQMQYKASIHKLLKHNPLANWLVGRETHRSVSVRETELATFNCMTLHCQRWSFPLRVSGLCFQDQEFGFIPLIPLTFQATLVRSEVATTQI